MMQRRTRGCTRASEVGSSSPGSTMNCARAVAPKCLLKSIENLISISPKHRRASITSNSWNIKAVLKKTKFKKEVLS